MPHKAHKAIAAVRNYLRHASLEDCERVRNIRVPRSCPRFKAEYIAQYDLGRHGKPFMAYGDMVEVRAIGRLVSDRYTPMSRNNRIGE